MSKVQYVNGVNPEAHARWLAEDREKKSTPSANSATPFGMLKTFMRWKARATTPLKKPMS